MPEIDNDNIKLAEQDLIALKTGLSAALTGLANLKDRQARKAREAENNRRLAEDFQDRAIAFLEKAGKGELDRAEADRLATEALIKKQDHAVKQAQAAEEAGELSEHMSEFQQKVDGLKAEIRQFENELLSLKARARAAAAALEAGRAVAEFDPTEAEYLLSRLKSRVEDEEDLARAYEEMAGWDRNIDDEIDRALGLSPDQKAAQLLEKLKKDLKI